MRISLHRVIFCTVLSSIGVPVLLYLNKSGRGFTSLSSVKMYRRFTTTRSVNSENRSFSTKHFLCSFYYGRLGNRMFEYAAVLGIAQRKGMVPCVTQNLSLTTIFKLGAKPMDKSTCRSSIVHSDKRASAFDEEAMAVDHNIDTILSGSFQSWRYFRNVESELRQHFTFNDKVLFRAKDVLTKYLPTEYQGNLTKIILVGIHVRRGDLLNKVNVITGYQVAPPSYFRKAMDYFRSKYKSVMFVLRCRDVDWCTKHIARDLVVYFPKQSEEIDLAILSLCDHVIMSVGTYGWWAGWLAGGITIYYSQQAAEGSDLDKKLNMSDYIYPGWIGLP